MTDDYWERYTPSKNAPWNRQRVEHLHRRLGFGATPQQRSRDLEDGFDRSIERFLSPDATVLDSRTEALARQAIDGNQIQLLKAAWVSQMWHGGDPLTEQLCLMWHNHFATSFLKVSDCDAMWQQNQMFRKLGRGKFGELITAILRDRAMLVWLDANTNRAGQPNENLARELLELFTLGVGNYSESDVKEVARVLTGWRVEDSGTNFDASIHDSGTTNILGSSDVHDVNSLADHLTNQTATSRRLAWRLCNHFLGANVPQDAIGQLAAGLRESQLDIQAAVARIVRSNLFFSDAELLGRIRPPVSFVVGGIRGLNLHQPSSDQPAVSPQVAAGWMAAMGQDLFQPPGVAGWQGGSVWLGTSAMVHRAAFALALSNGKLVGDAKPRPAARQLAHADSQRD
ncbi:MAG: DUF1800 domain-containing protein [Planctomycetales bacterium]|nr:DUF1800 domain-containing protein [Planctomycetales bacterium]